QPSTCRRASTTSTLPRHGSAAHLIRGSVRGPRRLLAGSTGRRVGVGVGDGADHARRRRSARQRLRAGPYLPRHHRAGARRGGGPLRRRRAHAHLRRASGRHRCGRPRPPRGLRERAPGDDGRRRRSARSALARRDRGRGRPRERHLTEQVERPAAVATFESSVLDHRFGSSAPFTLGVEEEYMLLDPETWDLVQPIDSVRAKGTGDEFAARVMPELMQSVIEITTPVCASAAEVEAQLRRLRRYVAGLAGADGYRFASAGTHPFSLFERQRITAKDRYRKLVDQMQYI